MRISSNAEETQLWARTELELGIYNANDYEYRNVHVCSNFNYSNFINNERLRKSTKSYWNREPSEFLLSSTDHPEWHSFKSYYQHITINTNFSNSSTTWRNTVSLLVYLRMFSMNTITIYMGQFSMTKTYKTSLFTQLWLSEATSLSLPLFKFQVLVRVACGLTTVDYCLLFIVIFLCFAQTGFTRCLIAVHRLSELVK